MKAIALALLFMGCTKKQEIKPAGLTGLEIAGLQELTATAPAKAFKLKAHSGEEFRFSGNGAEVVVKAVSEVSPEGFEKAVRLREFELERPFREERSPYAGAVSTTNRCPEAFRPKQRKSETESMKVWRAEVAASTRKTIVCSQGDFVFKNVEVIIYCPQSRRLFTVHGHFPKTDPKRDWSKWLSETKCI